MEKRELRVLSKRTVEVLHRLDNGGYQQSFLHYDEVVQDGCCIRLRVASKWGAWSVDGMRIFDVVYDSLEPFGNRYLGRQGFQRRIYDTRGELLFTETLGNYTIEGLLGGNVAVVRQVCKDWRFALFDVKNARLLSGWGHKCIEIASGFLLEDGDVDFEHSGYLFADYEGNVQKAEYSQIGRYQVLTVKGQCLVFENKVGILQLQCDELRLSDFNVHGGVWLVPVKDGKKALYDAKGHKILDFLYDEISRIGWCDGQELFWVKAGNKVGVVAKNDEQILSLQYKKVLPLEEGFLLVSMDAKEGYAQNDGNVVLPPIYQRVAVDFSSQMIKVFENDKCHICSLDGKKLFSDAYAEPEICLCKEGVIFENGAFMTRAGNVVLSGFTKIERLAKFGYEALVVCKDGKFGLYDFEGKEIIPVKYDLIEVDHFGYRGVNLFSI